MSDIKRYTIEMYNFVDSTDVLSKVNQLQTEQSPEAFRLSGISRNVLID